MLKENATTMLPNTGGVYHVRFNTDVGAKVYTVILSPYEGQYPTEYEPN